MIEPTFTGYFRNHRTDLDAVIFDIDGTLSLGKTPLPGARELLEELNCSHTPYLLLTNDGCNSVEQKAAYLKDAGIPVTPRNILSSGNALKLWAAQHYHGGKFFQLGKTGTPSYADAAGIDTTTDPGEINDCCGILCGEGVYDWHPAIEAAFNLLLKHPEYPMIVCNPDSYWASLRFQGMGIGSGAVARFICQVLADAGKKIEPTYLGKPYPPVYQCAVAFFKQLYPELKFNDPSRILMIGDSLESDIAGANANGMSSALVLTGITTEDMLETAPEAKRPDMIFKTL